MLFRLIVILSCFFTFVQAEEARIEGHGANFVADAHDENQRAVAIQLDGIDHPTPSQAQFLEELSSLSLGHIRDNLERLSGVQNSVDLFATDFINRQFIRRLYDPLRPIVTKNPCLEEWYDLEKYCCCYPYGINLWADADGSRTVNKGDTSKLGVKMDSVQGSLGVQKTWARRFTAGLAASYEYDHLHYRMSGSGNMNSVFGGVYALYRPSRCYLLADCAFGYSVNVLRRSIDAGDLDYNIHSNPKTTQLTFYAEGGVDISWEDLLIQPFVGLEIGRYQRESLVEHGDDDLELRIKARHRTLSSTRVGVHLTCDTLPSNLYMSIDLAWNYRCTSCNNDITVEFPTFGSPFEVEGIPLSKNFFDGALTVSKEIFCDLNCFGRFSGEMWEDSSSYTFLLGVNKAW